MQGANKKIPTLKIIPLPTEAMRNGEDIACKSSRQTGGVFIIVTFYSVSIGGRHATMRGEQRRKNREAQGTKQLLNISTIQMFDS